MTRSRNPEAGYALLLVYAMAASVAVMLYLELPKVIFEAQRDKEQLLIDRGEQYSRAVQLYVRKFNRFPIDIAALEKTQNIRFLRRKYVDPMTGKDDWRLIHVGPGGQFIDSVIYTKKQSDKNGPQTFITELQQMSAPGPAGPGGVNIAGRTRASDQPGAPGQQQTPSNPEPGAPPANSGPVMVLPDGRIVPANITGQAPPQPAPGQNPAQPGQAPQQGQNGIPQFNGIQTPNGIAIQPGGPPNAAANLINQILTTPRPQPGVGAPGAGNGLDQGSNGTPIAQQANGAGQTIGGGFAGVASKAEQTGIKSYAERSAYNEWEFVYDITKDPLRAGANRAPVQGGPQSSPTGPGPAQPQSGGRGAP